jgi:hypothetical protein
MKMALPTTCRHVVLNQFSLRLDPFPCDLSFFAFFPLVASNDCKDAVSVLEANVGLWYAGDRPSDQQGAG